MILGKKDKEYVKQLEEANTEQATNFFKYLHDEHKLTYTYMANKLGLSQQYINDLALGKKKIKNDTFYKLISKLFI